MDPQELSDPFFVLEDLILAPWYTGSFFFFFFVTVLLLDSKDWVHTASHWILTMPWGELHRHTSVFYMKPKAAKWFAKVAW